MRQYRQADLGRLPVGRRFGPITMGTHGRDSADGLRELGEPARAHVDTGLTRRGVMIYNHFILEGDGYRW